jgi:hypothetical protein
MCIVLKENEDFDRNFVVHSNHMQKYSFFVAGSLHLMKEQCLHEDTNS